MDPEVVLPTVAALGLGYVVLPAMAIGMVTTRREVVCPRDEEAALVRLERRRAVRSLFDGGSQHVIACSLWPERAGCDRACEAAL
jgi:hypothetical protein